MLKRTTYLLIHLFIYLNCNSQVNLVPNHSFEDTVGACDYNLGMSSISYWYSVQSTPDYYNPCSNLFNYPTPSTIPLNCRGYQQPFDGNTFSGSGLYFHNGSSDTINAFEVENIGVKLKHYLSKDKCYFGSMMISLSNGSKYAINQISMLFTQNAFTMPFPTYNNVIQPQIQWDTTFFFIDTLNWIKISVQRDIKEIRNVFGIDIEYSILARSIRKEESKL